MRPGSVSEEQRLEAARRPQEALAELGQRALSGLPVPELMDEALAIVASTLDVEHAEVLELLPDGESLLLRAGLGWKAGYVGHGTLSVSNDSQEGFTLLSGEPVVAADTRSESRFDGRGLWNEYGIVSSLSVVLAGDERPYGVLAAHATVSRTFGAEDVHFLQALANVLAGAISPTGATRSSPPERAPRRSRSRAITAPTSIWSSPTSSCPRWAGSSSSGG